MKTKQSTPKVGLYVALLFFFSFFAGSSAFASLSGSYTIDPSKAASSTNYTSFNDADSDLIYGSRASGGTANGAGVSGAVIFKVADGNYLESVDIPAITGTSSTNTITFQGHAGDSSKVVVTWTAGGGYSTPGYVFHLDGTDHIILNELTLHMDATGVSYSYYDHVVIVDNVSDYNQITNCQLIGGAGSGITYQGACIYSGYNYTTYTYSQDEYNTFFNNNMKDAYFGVYWIGNFTSGGAEVSDVFDHNMIDSMSYYGMMFETQDGLQVTNNKINMPYGNYALMIYYLGYSYYGNSTDGLIANNFISLASGSYNYGIYTYYSDYANIVYNNINCGGNSGYGAYIYSYSASALDVYNNNFVTSGCTPLYGYGFSKFDYNNFNTSITPLLTYNGTNYNTLAKWKASGTGFGAHDTMVDPIYVSSSDLHVNNPAINGKATPLSYDTTDIDGQVRDKSTPDIGADEFTPPAVNPAVSAITNPNSGFCVGSQDVYVNLSNFGLNTITSATIEWSVNGTAQTAYSWTGSLASGAVTSVKIGSYAFSSATTVYTIVSYPSSGNGTTITSTARNTSTKSVRSGMTGTFTIDPSKAASSSNYTSFRAAVSDLNLKGACGAITYNVADGYYNESIMLGAIPGTSATNTVTFQSTSLDSSKVTLDTSWSGGYSTPGYTVTLNGSNYITFREMTISNYGTAAYNYADVVYLEGGASHNMFERDMLLSSTTLYNYGPVVGNPYGTNENYNTLRYNTISGSYYTVFYQGSSNSPEIGNVVYRNNIDSSLGYGIFMEYTDSTYIVANNVYMPSNGYEGIYLYQNMTNGGGLDSSYIANNFITTGSSYCYSMMIYYSNMINIYYNSMNNSSSAYYYYAAYIYNYASGVIQNFANNIVVADNGASLLYAYNVSYSDYNDWYPVSGSVGYWNGATCAALTDLQTANGMDAHSVSGDPLYNSVSTGDLHLTTSSKLVIHTGRAIGSITTDIDGQIRNGATPNMGADETRVYGNDASAFSIDSPATGFCTGTKNVYVKVVNAGNNTISSVSVNWTVNGTTMTAYSWTGTLAPGAHTLVKIGSITFVSGVTESVIAWTSNPNGGTDSFTANDTTGPKIMGGGLNGTYTIGGLTPDYATFRDAVNDLLVRGVCGKTTFNVRDGYYNESVLINKSIVGANAINTITFQSQSLDSNKVILDTSWAGTYSARAYTVRLDGANWITFREMTIHNDPGSMYVYTDVVELGGKASHNTFANNVIATSTTAYSTYGSVIYDDYGTNETFNSFNNNQLNGGYYVIYMAGSGTGTNAEFGNSIHGNLIDSGAYMSVYLQYEDSVSITANTIIQTSGYYGLYLQYITGNGSGTDSSLIANNFINMLAGYGYGMMSYYNDMLNIYNNSIYSSCSYTYYYNLYMYNYTTSKVNLVNNIIDNDMGGALFYIYSTAVSYSNNNDWYTSGSYYGYWNASCSSLSDIQSANSMDANSVSGDPYFNSPSTGDLHLTSSSSIVLHKGVSRSSVTTDIDGQKRSALPNIGADETRVYGNDMSASAIDSPTVGFCSGTKDVYVKILNVGNNTVTSTNVNWSVNGTTMTSYSWTGSLAPGGSALVKVGSVTFASGSIKTFYAWTSKPNGGIDSFTLNDSVGPVKIGAGLTGTYTIGGLSPDFTSFNDAASALANSGVCGATVFNVRDGSYNESLVIGTVKGASSVNTVTFQSQSGDSSKVILDTAWAGGYSARSYVLRLNGASYVTFREMTIINNTSTMYSYTDAVEIAGGSNYNTFANDVITTPTSYYGSYGSAFYDDGASTDQYNTIKNNQINGGEYVVYMSGSYSKPEMGNMLSENLIDSATYMGVYLTYQDSVNFTKNQVIMTQGYYGLYLYYLMSNGTGKDSSLIANNFISVSSSYCYGVMSYYNSLLNFYNNSVNTSSTYTYYYSAYFYSYSSGNLNLVNNLFTNDGGGSVLYAYFSSTTVYSDYNDWYTTGSSLGYWNGTTCASLSDLQSADGMDAHSVSADPLYNSASTGDLHLTSYSSAVMHDGTYRASVPDDIDGQKRAAKPNMGADETHLYQIDASAAAIDSPSAGFCSGTKDIYVRLFNAGATNLTSVSVNWSVNGTTKTSYSWTGSLSSLSSTLVKVGSVTFVSGVSQYIKAWTSNPNSAVDSNALNDTTSARKGGGLNGTYTIGGAAPNYATFRAAVNDLNNLGVCGATVFNVRDGQYNESVTLGPITGASATSTITFQGKDSSLCILDTSWSGGYSAPGYVVELNNASYITFKEMTLMNTPSLSYNYADGIYITGGSGYNNFTSNIIVTNTSTTTYNYGYTVHNNYNSTDPYNNFSNNQINGGYYAVYLSGPYSSTGGETGNVFYHNMIDSASYMGLYVEYEDSMTISGNNINMSSGYYCVYMYGVQGNGSGSDSSYIINNFISNTSTYGYAMYGYYNDMLNIYNNSFYSDPSYSYYYTIYMYDYTTHVVNFVNNITQNDGGGYSLYDYNSIINCDFNDYYSAGSAIVEWNSTSCSTISDLNAANSMDVHSVSADAMFNSSSTGDLHLTSASSAVEHVGYPLKVITEDIDQQKRSAKPNLGADETRTYAFDASASAIDSPSAGFCSGTKDVYVHLLNAGSTTMTTCTIDWSVNGVAGTSYSWTGSLASFASTTVKLGSVTFAAGSSKAIKVWTSKPDGQVDSNALNDTVSARKGGGLTGTYTIGSGGSYTAFRDAVNALNTQGVCGPVVFNVIDGYYNESIEIKSIVGSSSINTITFQSKSLDSTKVVLDTTTAGSYSTRGYTVRLNGASYVSFRKMSITNVGGSNYDDVLELTGGASYNTIESNVMFGNTSGGYNYGSVIYDDPNSIDQYNTIRYNQLSGNYYTVYISGTYSGSEMGNVLYRNAIDSGNGYGLLLQYQDSVRINANNIFMTSGYYGLEVYGITTNSSGNDSSYIMNNFVTIQGSYSYGMMLETADMLNVYNNSVNSSGTNYYDGSVYIYNYTGTINMYNNSFVNDNSGTAVYFYGTSSSLVTDFNNYYSASGSYLAYWNGSYCTSVSDIQTASTLDGHSVSGDPPYVDPSTGDLHDTTASSVLSNAGSPIAAVTEDIDGNPRSLKTPDIGADEFGSYPIDLGISAVISPKAGDCGNTATLIELKVHNYGTTSQNNYSVNAIVYIGAKTYTASRTKTNSIAPGTDDTAWVFVTAPLNTSAGGTIAVKGYTNISGDGDKSNDADSVSISLTAHPTAKFSVANLGSICSGDSFNVTDKSGAGTFKYYLVNSSGVRVDSSTSANPKLYDAATKSGAYRIVQGVWNGGTCYDSTSVPATILASPVASFVDTTGCPGDVSNFHSTSTAGSGSISSYSWNFGNSKTATTPDAKTTYAMGSYTVLLTVKNSNGCSSTASVGVNIDTATASFTYTIDLTGGTGVHFHATDSNMTSYSWDFGDGSATSTAFNPTHIYSSKASYKVKLTATNGGCSGTDSAVIVYTGIATQEAADNYSLNIYPNPFREYTNISYSLEKPSQVKVEVMDVLGRQVATLVNHNQAAGAYNVKFDATEYNGTNAGVYIVRMTIGDRIITKQITLVK